MQTIIEHTKLIGRLDNNKINLSFISECSLSDLIKCCERIENNNLDKDSYAGRSIIQKELISDEQFMNYFKEMIKHNIDIYRITDLVSKLKENKEKPTSYELNTLIQILENTNITASAFYDYLHFFNNKVVTREQQNIIANNLSCFYLQDEVSISELTEEQRDLFFNSFMSDDNLIPIDNIKEVCELLIQDNELKNIILFLFSNNLSVPLNLRDYMLINKNSKDVYEYIQKLNKMLNNEQMYQLLLRWKENGCTAYDLKMLETKLKGLDNTDISKNLYNRSSYINFIFGNKLSNFPLEDIYGAREKLLIYAISNNKKRFIQLIQEYPQEFLDIGERSALYYQDFYEKYVNINTLTLKNLITLKTMCGYSMRIGLLKENNYTFEEICTLYDLPGQYFKLYNYLLDLKIDARMLIIRQLAKRNLLNNSMSDEEIEKLAQMLKIKNLYRWIEKDFAHIKGIKQENVITILLNYSEIKRFIPQIHDYIELRYVIRNINKLQQYDNLEDIKDNIETLDKNWKELVSIMDFNNQFINDNKQHIKNFLLKNGAELALTYTTSRQYNEQDTFKKILKAELMGQFKKLKYFTDDLHREIDFDLESEQITEWTSNNREIQNGEIQVKEYDDFYSTMILGESPQHTCLSYKNGAYNKCLMACFDSNKKIIYAKINDEIVGRAMVRLTKGTYSSYKETKEKLSFVDLENVQNIEVPKVEKNEYLTIFLETPYIAGVSSKQERQIKEMFISLLETKATNMNALLVVNNEYSDVVGPDYIVTRYHIYISKSKAGSQYLDSLNGENTITDEGQYKANTFMIWQK